MGGLWLLLTGLTACGPSDLGPCDEAAAHRVVYDERGYPYYAGQALVHSSCGQAAFCHSAVAEGKTRWGAPKGLDFDMEIASVDPSGGMPTPFEMQLRDHLAAGRRNVRDWGGALYDTVQSGWMPPKGRAGQEALGGASKYWYADDGSQLPPIGEAAGLHVLRNWLSCGAPVVERVSPHPAGLEPVGDVQPLGMPR